MVYRKEQKDEWWYIIMNFMGIIINIKLWYVTIIQTYDPLGAPQIANYSICSNKSNECGIYTIIKYGIYHN